MPSWPAAGAQEGGASWGSLGRQLIKLTAVYCIDSCCSPVAGDGSSLSQLTERERRKVLEESMFPDIKRLRQNFDRHTNISISSVFYANRYIYGSNSPAP